MLFEIVRIRSVDRRAIARFIGRLTVYVFSLLAVRAVCFFAPFFKRHRFACINGFTVRNAVYIMVGIFPVIRGIEAAHNPFVCC